MGEEGGEENMEMEHMSAGVGAQGAGGKERCMRKWRGEMKVFGAVGRPSCGRHWGKERSIMAI